MLKRLIICFSIFLSSNAYATGLTGIDLHTWINSSSPNVNRAAKTYIWGVIDTQLFFHEIEILQAKESKREPANYLYICPTKSRNYDQAFDIVKKYLQNNPENRNDDAAFIVSTALSKVWRCE